MIKMEVNKARIKGSIEGRLNDLIAETIMIVREVWESIKEQDEDAANEYVFVMSKIFADDFVFSEKREMGEKSVANSEGIAKGLESIAKAMEVLLNDGK